jgi:hypothetical protein
MWQNVGKVDDCTRSDRSDDGSRSTSSSRNNHYDPLLLRNHLVIHVDCSSANRGLFAGLIVMVATAVSIIVFFLAFSDRRYVTTVYEFLFYILLFSFLFLFLKTKFG